MCVALHPRLQFAELLQMGTPMLPGAAVQVDVNGPNASPVFQFLKQHTPADMGGSADIDWNFAKWVVRLSALDLAEVVYCAIALKKCHTNLYEGCSAKRNTVRTTPYSLLINLRSYDVLPSAMQRGHAAHACYACAGGQEWVSGRAIPIRLRDGAPGGLGKV